MLVPPHLGLVRLAIPGFAALNASERLQAAVLALRRDLSINAMDLRVAAMPAPEAAASRGYALVAWCDGGAQGGDWQPATVLPGAIEPGRLYWVDAPGGYLVGEMGAVVVENHDGGQSLPAEVLAMLGSSACQTVTDIVLVNRDTVALPLEQVAWWSAASGVSLHDGGWPESTPVHLVRPPTARVRTVATPLDRALRWALAAALVCAALSAWRYVALPEVPPLAAAPATTSTHATAGALLDRIAVVAPDLLSSLQSATYAGGAWVLVLADSYDPGALRVATRMLESNGLIAQSALAPSPRVRISVPSSRQSQ